MKRLEKNKEEEKGIKTKDYHLHIPITHNTITPKNLLTSSLDCKPGSSVSIVSGYGLDDQAIEVRSPAEAKGCFL
jgi:hypothetical protein